MSNLLPLKKQITYGPVASRRLGRSLGINLLPPTYKWCTFDCLYCQYGWTPDPADSLKGKWNPPSIEMVIKAVEIYIKNLGDPPAYLTFSGNGEPTLHPHFLDLVEAIHILRNRLIPHARIALLSNSSRMVDPAVSRAISYIDKAILKLDAGNESVFQSYNRPVWGINYNEIVTSLGQIGSMTLQSLFTEGPQGNLQQSHIDCWIERVEQIHPDNVQIYTLSRPFPSKSITPASRESLQAICHRLNKRGIQAEVF